MDKNTAQVHMLFNGYVNTGVSPYSVASSVAFVRDGEARVVIDPGMVPSPRAILDPLERLGQSPAGITDVIFSHHHPDHTLHAALFPNARFHDFWAIYKGDTWASRRAEGFDLSPSIKLIETPGHTPESISLLVYARRGDAVPHAVLTGDTLFIGDVGRPDLAAAVGLRRDDMARELYRSLREHPLVVDGGRSRRRSLCDRHGCNSSWSAEGARGCDADCSWSRRSLHRGP